MKKKTHIKLTNIQKGKLNEFYLKFDKLQTQK